MFADRKKSSDSAFDDESLGAQVFDPTKRGSVLISGVSKRFRKHTIVKGYSTVKSSLLKKLWQRSSGRDGWFNALYPLSVQVPAGCSLGVIGRNGSGKSTLLKLIAGIYRPDSGKVAVNGRISALIELGAGFHPDFTGRENVYLGGVMFGLTKKEIDQRFDAIVEFSELGDFIDDPVRTYSSGMYTRLGFSLAVHTDPDVLLVDEVLAVGDAAFISRCHDTISELKRKGKTLVFVTHDLNSVVRWCDEAIWLDKGRVVKRGEPKWVIDSYIQEVEESEQRHLSEANRLTLEEEASVSTDAGAAGETSAAEQAGAEPRGEKEVHRWGNRDVEITDVRMLAQDGAERWLFQSEESAVVEVDFSINSPVEELVFGIGIIRADGLGVHGTNTELEDIEVPLPDEGAVYPINGRYRYIIDRLGLVEDSYYLDVAAHKSDGFPFDYHHLLHKFSVRSQLRQQGVLNPPHRWEIETEYAERPAAANRANGDG